MTDTLTAPQAPESHAIDLPNLLLSAWFEVRRKRIDVFANLNDLDQEERVIPGVAIYLMRNMLDLDSNQIAEKLGIPLTSVLRTNAEMVRFYANDRHGARGKIGILKAKYLAMGGRTAEQIAHAIRDAKYRVEKTVRPTEIDGSKADALFVHLARVFSIEKEDIRGGHDVMTDSAIWARRVAISLLHHVIVKGVSCAMVGAYFNYGSSAAHKALNHISDVARSRAPADSYSKISQVCAAYDVDPDVLVRE